jgi:hypothetical protein
MLLFELLGGDEIHVEVLAVASLLNNNLLFCIILVNQNILALLENSIHSLLHLKVPKLRHTENVICLANLDLDVFHVGIAVAVEARFLGLAERVGVDEARRAQARVSFTGFLCVFAGVSFIAFSLFGGAQIRELVLDANDFFEELLFELLVVDVCALAEVLLLLVHHYFCLIILLLHLLDSFLVVELRKERTLQQLIEAW